MSIYGPGVCEEEKTYRCVETSQFLRLRCGEENERKVIFRDFFIPNQHFGLEIDRLFINYTVTHFSGKLTPCSIIRLKLDSRFLKIRFALQAPWRGKLKLHTRVDVLSSNVNIEQLDYVRQADGELADWT